MPVLELLYAGKLNASLGQPLGGDLLMANERPSLVVKELVPLAMKAIRGSSELKSKGTNWWVMKFVLTTFTSQL